LRRGAKGKGRGQTKNGAERVSGEGMKEYFMYVCRRGGGGDGGGGDSTTERGVGE